MVRLEIELLGETLQVREANRTWSGIYPGQTFHAQGMPFSYDSLREMGNGIHEVKRKKPAVVVEPADGANSDEKAPDAAPRKGGQSAGS
jgi:hypothetical protein